MEVAHGPIHGHRQRCLLEQLRPAKPAECPKHPVQRHAVVRGVVDACVELLGRPDGIGFRLQRRSEEHTSELQSLMRISYAVFCLKKKKKKTHTTSEHTALNHHFQLLSHQTHIKHKLT